MRQKDSDKSEHAGLATGLSYTIESRVFLRQLNQLTDHPFLGDGHALVFGWTRRFLSSGFLLLQHFFSAYITGRWLARKYRVTMNSRRSKAQTLV